jgi:hypothetical protein
VSSSHTPLPSDIGPALRRFVEELRRVKQDAGLSLSQLSARTHYSRASWDRWLNAKRLATQDAVSGLADLVHSDLTLLWELRESAEAELAGAAPRRHTTVCADAAADDAQSPAEWPLVAHVTHVAQLPPEIPDFTGRAQTVAQLVSDVLLSDAGRVAGRTPVITVCGAPGVGKTALVTRVTHLAASSFPDGALYADLRGSCADPRDPSTIIGDWLCALGDAPQSLPGSLDARSARLRSLLHRRRVLLLLDDAHDAAQVRSLIPGSAGCAVLVATRIELPELACVRRVRLEGMTDADARALLTAAVGERRVAAEPDAAAAIIEACDGLPLALRIAGFRLAARPGWAVRALADRLTDPGRALDTLSIGSWSVRAAFASHYRRLCNADTGTGFPIGRAFRLLGLAGVRDFATPAAAALFGVDANRAELTLDALVDANILRFCGPDRYQLPGLARAYAAEVAATHAVPGERSVAVERPPSPHCTTTRRARAFTFANGQQPRQSSTIRVPGAR